jgi:selenocysteine lyase/cysteine desulfurase
VSSFERLRAGFPIAQTGALFLDHCRVAVTPQATVDAMHQFTQATALEGVNYPEKAARYDRFKQRAAALLGASTDEIAFVGNTAHGIHLVANGLAFEDGDNIVTARGEYPDNVYPWLYLERRGVTTRFVEPRHQRVEADDVIAAIDARTRLVALSLVQFASGYRLDAVRIGEACRARRVAFLLDAVQGVGALGLDVGRTPVDFVATGGHKWLLGPLGSGLFYCRRDRLEDLAVTTIGAGSMAHHAVVPYRIALRPDAERFEGGSAKNTPGIYGLDASLGVLLDAGIDRIEAHILDLTAHAIEGLRSRGYRIESPHEAPAQRSGIVTYRGASHGPDEIVAHLLRDRILTSTSPLGARIAPHFYNTHDDIDRFLAALP